jgi:hypothetical protein
MLIVTIGAGETVVGVVAIVMEAGAVAIVMIGSGVELMAMDTGHIRNRYIHKPMAMHNQFMFHPQFNICLQRHQESIWLFRLTFVE